MENSRIRFARSGRVRLVTGARPSPVPAALYRAKPLRRATR